MFHAPPKLRPEAYAKGVLRVKSAEGGVPRVDAWTGSEWLHIPAITAMTVKVEATDFYPTTTIQFDALAIIDLELRQAEAFGIAGVPAWIKAAAKLHVKLMKTESVLIWHIYRRWMKK